MTEKSKPYQTTTPLPLDRHSPATSFPKETTHYSPAPGSSEFLPNAALKLHNNAPPPPLSASAWLLLYQSCCNCHKLLCSTGVAKLLCVQDHQRGSLILYT
eukprot:740531-Pelagomonas_calceolata.AAC.5